jgi:hypothetical protein
MSIILDHPGAAVEVNKSQEHKPIIFPVPSNIVDPTQVIINPNVEVTAPHLAPIQIHIQKEVTVKPPITPIIPKIHAVEVRPIVHVENAHPLIGHDVVIPPNEVDPVIIK